MKKNREFFIKYFDAVLVFLVLVGILFIAFLVQYKFSFLNFFFLPVILAGYYSGKKRAVLTGIFCILVVILYVLFASPGTNFRGELSIVNLVTWGGFLILTGAIIGGLSEQRETRINNLRRAHIGLLEILFKYLETADFTKPVSLRVSLLSGRIAEAAGLEKRVVENIKSAAMLSKAAELRSFLYLFDEVTDFIKLEADMNAISLKDKEKVILKATASLLHDVEPLLTNYFLHYVQEADKLDKNLNEIPLGSSIIALADIYDEITERKPSEKKFPFSSFNDIKKYAGRTFPTPLVTALELVVTDTPPLPS